jgi:ORF6N domain-containing protein
VVEASVAKRSFVPVERIEGAILVLRGHKVILDKDLAALYGVTTGNLNKAVNRNIERFPADFMLRLTEAEFDDLRFQFGRSRWGGTRTLPRAFTEQGVAMLSSVLRSRRAALVNLEIMRAFVRLREMIATNRDLARRLDELEKRYDTQFKGVFDAIRQLMAPPVKSRRSIGFRVEETRPAYRVRRPGGRARV